MGELQKRKGKATTYKPKHFEVAESFPEKSANPIRDPSDLIPGYSGTVPGYNENVIGKGFQASVKTQYDILGVPRRRSKSMNLDQRKQVIRETPGILQIIAAPGYSGHVQGHN